jgi:glutamate-ammonia-ligase adenylyltransferase
MTTLRKFRLREALRLIWRDVNRIDSVEQTLAGSSALAEACLRPGLGSCPAQPDRATRRAAR